MQASQDGQPCSDHAGLYWNQCVLLSALFVHFENQRKSLKSFIVLEKSSEQEKRPLGHMAGLAQDAWFIDHTRPLM